MTRVFLQSTLGIIIATTLALEASTTPALVTAVAPDLGIATASALGTAAAAPALVTAAAALTLVTTAVTTAVITLLSMFALVHGSVTFTHVNGIGLLQARLIALLNVSVLINHANQNSLFYVTCSAPKYILATVLLYPAPAPRNL